VLATPRKTRASERFAADDRAGRSDAWDSASGGDAEIIQIRLNQPLDEIVQKILEAALNVEGGNRSRAARRLGISLRTVQRYLSHTNSRSSSVATLSAE
jgi:DNA-binding NtrC family response regulator